MPTSRKSLFSVIALCALMLATGCQRERAPGAGKRIGVLLPRQEQLPQSELQRSLEQAARARGYDLLTTVSDTTLAGQKASIEEFVRRKVDAIILWPASSKDALPAAEPARAAGIPLFTIGITLPAARAVAHVGPDDAGGGRIAARYLVKTLSGAGRVAIIGWPESPSMADREAGFKEELANAQHMTLVAAVSGGGALEQARKAVDDLLRAHPELDAIFATDDQTALAVLGAAQARGLRNIIIVGYGGTPDVLRAVAGGTALRADVVSQPRLLGAAIMDGIASVVRRK
ncbi:MAG: sugar ABC transporter substrate-binding protein [Gemmatimonadaceae bacterium]